MPLFLGISQRHIRNAPRTFRKCEAHDLSIYFSNASWILIVLEKGESIGHELLCK